MKSILLAALILCQNAFLFCQINQFESGIKVPGFKKSNQIFPSDVTCRIILKDFDNDSDLDMVFANMRSSAKLWFNNGSGIFIESEQEFPTEMHDVAVGDLDLDGDHDIIFASTRETTISPLFMNTGSGNFNLSDFNLESGEKFKLIDINNDNYPDLFLMGRGTGIYLNNKRNSFTKTDLTIAINYSVDFADFNNDGSFDFISGERGKGIKVY